jgi:hypothetical protein
MTTRRDPPRLLAAAYARARAARPAGEPPAARHVLAELRAAGVATTEAHVRRHAAALELPLSD